MNDANMSYEEKLKKSICALFSGYMLKPISAVVLKS